VPTGLRGLTIADLGLASEARSRSPRQGRCGLAVARPPGYARRERAPCRPWSDPSVRSPARRGAGVRLTISSVAARFTAPAAEASAGLALAGAACLCWPACLADGAQEAVLGLSAMVRAGGSWATLPADLWPPRVPRWAAAPDPGAVPPA